MNSNADRILSGDAGPPVGSIALESTNGRGARSAARWPTSAKSRIPGARSPIGTPDHGFALATDETHQAPSQDNAGHARVQARRQHCRQAHRAQRRSRRTAAPASSLSPRYRPRGMLVQKVQPPDEIPGPLSKQRTIYPEPPFCRIVIGDPGHGGDVCDLARVRRESVTVRVANPLSSQGRAVPWRDPIAIGLDPRAGDSDDDGSRERPRGQDRFTSRLDAGFGRDAE